MGELGEGVADAAEFAGVAEAVLEASEDARDVADVVEPFAEFAEVERVGQEFADEGGAALDLGEVECGGGEPALQEAGAGWGGTGTIIEEVPPLATC